jgi:ankyrin repeat protein
VVKLLLENGNVDVGMVGSWGQTPLSYAAAGGHETVVQRLRGNGNAVD